MTTGCFQIQATYLLVKYSVPHTAQVLHCVLAHLHIWDFQVSWKGIIYIPVKIDVPSAVLCIECVSARSSSSVFTARVTRRAHLSESSALRDSSSLTAFSIYLLISYLIHWPVRSFCLSNHYLILLIRSHPFSSRTWKGAIFSVFHFSCCSVADLDFVSSDISNSESRVPFGCLEYVCVHFLFFILLLSNICT